MHIYCRVTFVRYTFVKFIILWTTALSRLVNHVDINESVVFIENMFFHLQTDQTTHCHMCDIISLQRSLRSRIRG